MKILIVDDDPDILLIASLVLGNAGHAISTASGGREALLLATSDPPDALLVDFNMDDLDGPAVLARLREDARLASLPVVFLTGETDPAKVETIRALGVSGIIAKPFDPTRFAEEVARALGP